MNFFRGAQFMDFKRKDILTLIQSVNYVSSKAPLNTDARKYLSDLNARLNKLLMEGAQPKINNYH